MRLALALLLIASPLAAQICGGPTYLYGVTGCPSGTSCTATGSTLTAVQTEANLRNLAQLCAMEGEDLPTSCDDGEILEANSGGFVCAPAPSPDLSGYALLAGRSGGQTLIGGTGSTDDLVLDGSAGTAGSLLVTESGKLRFDLSGDPFGWYVANASVGWFEVQWIFPRLAIDGNNGGVVAGGYLGLATNPNAPTATPDTMATRPQAGAWKLENHVVLPQRDSPPSCVTNSATIYHDSSGALCVCVGSTWTNLLPSGSCS